MSENEIPSVCPNCKSVGTMDYCDIIEDDMTEGQLAEAICGNHAVALCSNCGHGIDIGF